MEWSAEEEDISVCAQCGEEVQVELGRGYPFGEEQALCFACATARGGVYDELHDRWTRPPTLEGLPVPVVAP